MSQHLWMWTGGGGRSEPCCYHAPKWDYSKTTETIGVNVAVWQGEGDRCKVCLKRLAVMLRELRKTEDGPTPMCEGSGCGEQAKHMHGAWDCCGAPDCCPAALLADDEPRTTEDGEQP